MTPKTIRLNDDLYDYVLNHSLRENPILTQLRQETAAMPEAHMQIAPEQGQLMAMLATLIHARKAIEIGVFTGYSAAVVAEVLPQDGTLIACDIDPDYLAVAQRYWERIGVRQKIDLRVQAALQTLDDLIQAGDTATFDFAFLDADKEHYIDYYERLLVLLRDGGLMVIDNVLWSGRILDPNDQSPATCAIRAFNDHIKSDERVSITMLPVADGITVAMKRPMPAP